MKFKNKTKEVEYKVYALYFDSIPAIDKSEGTYSYINQAVATSLDEAIETVKDNLTTDKFDKDNVTTKHLKMHTALTLTEIEEGIVEPTPEFTVVESGNAPKPIFEIPNDLESKL